MGRALAEKISLYLEYQVAWVNRKWDPIFTYLLCFVDHSLDRVIFLAYLYKFG